MTNSTARRRIAIAAATIAAAIGAAAPAQAAAPAGTPGDCDVRLERLEAQFRDMEARHGWEDAAEWWGPRWQAYFQSCVIH
jgi:hypothetical protein